jgi:cytosine/adenosine deaminase-related metal-dependent hydrolase
MLRLVGSWVEGWQPPGCGPVEFLEQLAFLDARTLVVHGVQLSDRSLERLASIGCTLVTCPRSNQWVGVGVPPIARFYASGVAVAVGTDSLASAEDLNLFAELKAMRWLAPDVPAGTLLESATLAGARALGFDSDLGSIEVGKLAKLIAVEVPAHTTNVEEYLVSGINPRQIRWVDA